MHTSAPPTDTESVVLLDERRQPSGTALKAGVHTSDTPLHLAFSCWIYDDAGRVLLTRRALSKLTWPGVWTNSFCGHPGPGESFEDAIARRAQFELGLEVRELQMVLPDFAYWARDASGVVENEFCPVFRAKALGLDPNPAEVMDTAWIAPHDLDSAVTAAPMLLSPWLVEQWCELRVLDA